MRYLVVMLTVLWSLTSYAAVDVDMRGLSDAERAELVKQAEAMKAAKGVSTVQAADTVDKVDRWVNIGERVGKMLGGAAKEVGIAANDFVKTPVGQMAAFLIVWSYVGDMLVHVVCGWAFLIVTLSAIVWAGRQTQKIEVVYDKEKGTNWLGRYPVLSVTKSELDGEAFAIMLLAGFIAGVISLGIMFSW